MATPATVLVLTEAKLERAASRLGRDSAAARAWADYRRRTACGEKLCCMQIGETLFVGPAPQSHAVVAQADHA